MEEGQSKYINGHSRENIICGEFQICAEARERFDNFERYCIGQELCPHQALTTDRNDERILMGTYGGLR